GHPPITRVRARRRTVRAPGAGVRVARKIDPAGGQEDPGVIPAIPLESGSDGGSGWAAHPRERRAVYHRPHAFPPDAPAWLKERFRRWDDLLDAARNEVTRLVYSGGMSARKTASLYGALGKLKETFGRCTLEPARNWPDDRLEALLCSLPEISRKSAYCVMMYALGRKVFPVDTYVGRCLARLGPYRELGLQLEGLDHKKLQAVLADPVPRDL